MLFLFSLRFNLLRRFSALFLFDLKGLLLPNVYNIVVLNWMTRFSHMQTLIAKLVLSNLKVGIRRSVGRGKRLWLNMLRRFVFQEIV